MKLLLTALLLFVPPLSTAAPVDTLNWVGCGISKKSYVTDLAKAFEEKYNIHINIEGGGASKGIRHVATGKADLGGTCRYTLPDDPREAGIGLEPIAWDALVVITHKNNPVDSISMQQVHDIYSGKITNWYQLGGENSDMQLYTRTSKYSGVGRTLRKLVFADFDYEIASSQSFPSSGPLEKAVENNSQSIGITGVSSARLRDVKILKIGGTEPSYDNIKSGEYIMYRPLYLVYNPESSKINLVKKFIKFCHNRAGRNIMKKNGTLPYIDGLPLVMKQIDQDTSAYKRGADLTMQRH